ncbi:aICARFT IMPCHase bienzyme, putative [Babesia ovata]|uniref:AICARFT IMPCHase bienzyme, putative n=1 Tax=Babesia ovata TaxID=189622 RepID=A0A2H6KH77_9APIC|nr:aICARFT IMPCHase bienzyme, putative [Babesia ovata]XP_028868596.1 aICARFT IMPCHase bienzyme, putative [Babesia ovata]XP_028868599.1 aICARFT IMPCHase bienzyme, putative [Babesia ovata]GBE62347.1 aICARFT IMPCHase bienzyme, putative [Babesia ovata]GBE62353.1 aICARFT IMPCHase bienzyme, putative [Babesia ovata]GBE62356.1 aICARFT IMPCHase bienzyme, putative [Babesia ovata]
MLLPVDVCHGYDYLFVPEHAGDVQELDAWHHDEGVDMWRPPTHGVILRHLVEAEPRDFQSGGVDAAAVQTEGRGQRVLGLEVTDAAIVVVPVSLEPCRKRDDRGPVGVEGELIAILRNQLLASLAVDARNVRHVSEILAHPHWSLRGIRLSIHGHDFMPRSVRQCNLDGGDYIPLGPGAPVQTAEVERYRISASGSRLRLRHLVLYGHHSVRLQHAVDFHQLGVHYRPESHRAVHQPVVLHCARERLRIRSLRDEGGDPPRDIPASEESHADWAQQLHGIHREEDFQRAAGVQHHVAPVADNGPRHVLRQLLTEIADVVLSAPYFDFRGRLLRRHVHASAVPGEGGRDAETVVAHDKHGAAFAFLGAHLDLEGQRSYPISVAVVQREWAVGRLYPALAVEADVGSLHHVHDARPLTRHSARSVHYEGYTRTAAASVCSPHAAQRHPHYAQQWRTPLPALAGGAACSLALLLRHRH